MPRAELSTVIRFPRFAGPRPVPLVPPVAAPAFAARRRSYTLDDVIALCGLDGLSRRVAVDRLRELAQQAGMPLPKNPRRWQGVLQVGPLAIGTRSVWCALRFDAWLDRPRPAGPHDPGADQATAAPAPAARATRAAMAATAARLAGAA